MASLKTLGVDECGKFKTGEEKGSGRFEEEGGRVFSPCLGGEWRDF